MGHYSYGLRNNVHLWTEIHKINGNARTEEGCVGRVVASWLVHSSLDQAVLFGRWPGTLCVVFLSQCFSAPKYLKWVLVTHNYYKIEKRLKVY